jgi:hypothetical protein
MKLVYGIIYFQWIVTLNGMRCCLCPLLRVCGNEIIVTSVYCARDSDEGGRPPPRACLARHFLMLRRNFFGTDVFIFIGPAVTAGQRKSL